MTLQDNAIIADLEHTGTGAISSDEASVTAGHNFLKYNMTANGAAIIALASLADKFSKIGGGLELRSFVLPIALFTFGVGAAILAYGLAYFADAKTHDHWGHAYDARSAAIFRKLPDRAKALALADRALVVRERWRWSSVVAGIASFSVFAAGSVITIVILW